MQLNKKIIGLLFGFILILAAFYAIYVHRSLTFDGARWFVHLGQTQTPVLDPPHWRFSNILIQLPALIFSKLEMLKWSFYSFNFFYNAIHLFSFFVCFLYLKTKNELDHLWLLFLCFGGVLIPGLIFPTNSINEAFSVFMPLLLFQTFGEKNIRYHIIMGVGVLYLTFSYPLSLLLLACLALNATIKKLWVHVAAITIAFFIKFGLNYRVYLITKDTPDSAFFYSALKNFFIMKENYLFLLLLSTTFIYLSLKVFEIKYRKWLPLICAPLLLFLAIKYFDETIHPLHHRGLYFRGIIAPLVSVSAIFFIFFRAKLKTSLNEVSFCIMVTILIFVNLFQDLRTNQIWSQQKETLKELGPGCHSITDVDKEQLFPKGLDIRYLAVPMHSYVDSILTEKPRINFISYNPQNILNNADHCSNYHPKSNRFIYQYLDGVGAFMFETSANKSHPQYYAFERRPFSMEQLNDCQTPSLYHFDDETIKVNLGQILPGKQLQLKMRGNSSPENSPAAVSMIINGIKVKTLILSGEYQTYKLAVPRSPLIPENTTLNLHFARYNQFRDTLLYNSNFFILNCIKVL